MWPPSPLSISAARALLIGLSRAVFLPRFGPMPAELRDNADGRLLAGARVAGQASPRSVSAAGPKSGSDVAAGC